MGSVDSTATPWDRYNEAADAAGETALDVRDPLDNAVAHLVKAERAAVVGQLYFVAARPDSGPPASDVVRPVPPAAPGVRCTCGRPAVEIIPTEDHGDVPWCGVPGS